jgi:chorismate lyase/3-hydroxybenzoate synthase
MSGAPARSAALGRKPRDRRPAPASMLAYRADAADDTAADGVLLADIGHGPTHRRSGADPRRIVIGTPPIGGCSRELWRLPAGPVTCGWSGDIGYVQGGDFLFAHVLVAEPAGADLAQLSRDAYGRLLAFVRGSPCPELLRMWNYLSRINEQEHGMERYQAFCKGRAQAFSEADIPAHRFPAATAIGSAAPGLSVHLLAGRRPGTPIENPRQVSAYDYPLPYGPRPPSFARAMCYAGPKGSRELAISGTASIVGHLTMHPKDLGRQLRETLRNLDMLADHARLAPRGPADPPLLLKVYLRDPRRLPEVAPALRQWAGPRSRIMYLQGAICRQALDIEIEAHGTTPHASPHSPHRIEPAGH